MFTSIVFTAVLASTAVLRSHAIVDPNEPGPGEVFKQGTTCHVGWGGDDSGTDAWKDMAIELMSGPNEAMVHLTTVAQHKDGSTAGTLDYPCPEVTPNSQIYFYQFTAAGTSNFTWTGRFTIAGADGSTTDPTESGPATDPEGKPVLWGKGALVDPSTAVAAPTFNSSSSENSSSASGSPNSASNSASSTPSGSANTPSKSSGSPSAPSSPSKSASGSPSSSAPQNSGSSAAIAVGPMALDTRVWPFVAALTASALGFTILL